SELPKVVTELSNFDMFHVSEEKGSPSDPHVDDLALRSYRLFIGLDEILKELSVKEEAGLIQTLMKGHQKIEKEKFRAKDWADFVSRLEADAKLMIEEFKKIVSERSILQKQIEESQALKEAFAMLSRLSIDLDTMRSLRRFHLVFSVVSTKDLKEVGRSIPDDIFVSTPLTRDKSAILIATPRVEAERVERVLRSFDIRPFEILESLPQNPAEAFKAVSQDLKQQTGRLQELNGMLNTTLEKSRRKMLSLREGAKMAYDVLTSIKKAGDLKRFAVVKGFFPTDRLAKFEERFGKWILFTEDVEHGGHGNEEEVSSTPTIMKNLPFIRAFENITLNQGPPKYGELDPTPIITLTFPIFYGIMFGDFGHGVVLTLFGLFLYIRGYGSLKQWGVMLTVAGLSAAAVGLMIGEVFGFAIGEIIPGLEHPLLEVVERAHGVTTFNPEAITTILQIAILIGITHLTIGFGLDVFKAFREKEYVEAYTEKLSTFLMYLFGIVFALAFIGAGTSFSGLLTKQDPIPLLGLPVAQATAISVPIILLSVVVLIVGKPVAILLKKAPKDSIAMSLMMGVVEFLIRIVEFLANTMSYARLGILLLVHAALLMVLNRVVSLPLGVAIPMLIVFNILIMMLEGLIVYIQDLRLHLYEWFTKFYEGTGLLFRRIKPETTYVYIEWEQNT
ncbi:MAG: V-type ATP synthase subunit I, partial [Nitrososphaerales archaeon]